MGRQSKSDIYEAHTRQVTNAGFACAGCGLSDRLYSDAHGTFCARCGPSEPLQRTTLTWSLGSGHNLADAHSKNPPEAEHG